MLKRVLSACITYNIGALIHFLYVLLFFLVTIPFSIFQVLNTEEPLWKDTNIIIILLELIYIYTCTCVHGFGCFELFSLVMKQLIYVE